MLNNTKDILLRALEERDNAQLAIVVKNTLAEFGANRPGTVFFDKTTDDLYGLFKMPGSIYFVATQKENILGGGGIYPTDGLPADTCELVKMYLVPEARGLGLGKKLIEKCLAFAKAAGYKHVYLETMPELKKALIVYKNMGFHYLDGPMGNSGHFGCELWMLKTI